MTDPVDRPDPAGGPAVPPPAGLAATLDRVNRGLADALADPAVSDVLAAAAPPPPDLAARLDRIEQAQAWLAYRLDQVEAAVGDTARGVGREVDALRREVAAVARGPPRSPCSASSRRPSSNRGSSATGSARTPTRAPPASSPGPRTCSDCRCGRSGTKSSPRPRATRSTRPGCTARGRPTARPARSCGPPAPVPLPGRRLAARPRPGRPPGRPGHPPTGGRPRWLTGSTR